MNRDLDDLTPLDARNSLLMDPAKMPMSTTTHLNADTAYYNDAKNPLIKTRSEDSFESSNPYGQNAMAMSTYRDERTGMMGSTTGPRRSNESTDRLVPGDAVLAGKQPTVPNMGYRGVAY
jgi:hypothetical protein